MAIDLDVLVDSLAFLTERHLASLTTIGRDGALHVVPVGFTWDQERRLARILTRAGSQKVANIGRSPDVAICQINGAAWLTLRGTAVVSDDREAVAEAVRRYAQRYRSPEERDDRVVIEVTVTSALGRLPSD